MSRTFLLLLSQHPHLLAEKGKQKYLRKRSKQATFVVFATILCILGDVELFFTIIAHRMTLSFYAANAGSWLHWSIGFVCCKIDNIG
jgi:hypothetical protein